jgi:hypothetical protein
MKKITISITNILVLTCLISFLLLSTHTINGAEIDQSKDKYIAAKSGLNLRSGPGKSSKVIIAVPFGEKVTLENSESDEIFLDGVYGRWVNVKYKNNTGWIFSGFLCDFEPDTIIKPVADFYRNEYRKHKILSKFKEYTHFEDSEVSIKNIIDNYIVLKIPASMPDRIDPWHGDVVWRYDVKQKKFFDAYSVVYERTVYLLYLDDDKYPDLVVEKARNIEAGDVEILLGSETGFIKIYDSFQDHDNGCESYFYPLLTIGHCGDTELAHAYNNNAYFLRFNCKNRKFEKYAESKIISSEGVIISVDFKNMSFVVKDSKDSKNKIYKISDRFYKSDESIKYLKKELQKGKNISFEYITIGDEKICFGF